MKINRLGSSYRDPSGFVFEQDNTIYRQVNNSYKENYDLLMESGLYKKLIDSRYLIPHKEVAVPDGLADAYKIIQPDLVPFISYPAEWCFSQLKAAALLVLKIQKEALNFGLSLKDASAFNVQFIGSEPIFIDTLSFEKYSEGEPWIAYKQFCEHFLAPLSLYAFTDERLNKLVLLNINGLPLDLASKLLPLRAKLRPTIFLHIVMHAKSQQHYQSTALRTVPKKSFSRQSFSGLLDNLETFIQNLSWHYGNTAWTDYYEQAVSYETEALTAKKNLVSDYLNQAKTKTLWDVGANAGLFSRLAADKEIFVVSMDYDPTVIEQNYLQIKKEGKKNILPLVIDLVNPTPAIGWHNQEREAIFNRPLPDTVLALALIHHLAIANNLPLAMISQLFADIANNLIIEFVPKEDKQVQILLQSREDIFKNYTLEAFESEFSKLFEIKSKTAIPGSKRFLYLMSRKKI